MLRNGSSTSTGSSRRCESSCARPTEFRAAARDQDLLDDRFVVLGRRSVEIERLLDLHRDDLRHVVHQRLDRFLFDAFDRVDHAAFDRFRLLEVEPEASLQNISELAAADRDVAGEQRTRALDDIHVHRRGTDIKKRHDVVFGRRVVHFVAVLQGERVDVDDDRRLCRRAGWPGVILSIRSRLHAAIKTCVESGVSAVT